MKRQANPPQSPVCRRDLTWPEHTRHVRVLRQQSLVLVLRRAPSTTRACAHHSLARGDHAPATDAIVEGYIVHCSSWDKFDASVASSTSVGSSSIDSPTPTCAYVNTHTHSLATKHTADHRTVRTRWPLTNSFVSATRPADASLSAAAAAAC